MNKQSLRQRITVAFLLLTFIICSLFSLATFTTIHSLETDLFSRFFTEHARWLIKRHLEQPLEQDDLPEIESFFDVQKDDTRTLPSYLQNLSTGWHEITSGTSGLHVYVEDIGQRRYLVVHDQSEFERREVIIGVTLFTGILCSLAFAWWISASIAGQVIKPLSKLASAIKQQHPINPHDFAQDEVGKLADIFASYRYRLEGFLMRERFFTSDVSHELRTPLMSATAAVELLLSTETDARRHATLERAHAALQDMRNLVESFLALARQSPHSKPQGSVSAAAIAQQEVFKLASTGGEDLIRRMRCIVQRDMMVDCAPTLLSVVLGNLLRNASYYCAEGPIEIIIAAPEIMITDAGSGIEHAIINAVFGHAERPENPVATQKVEGHGLGLFIVKRICDHFGWQINVETHSSGTRFTLRIPEQRAVPA